MVPQSCLTAMPWMCHRGGALGDHGTRPKAHLPLLTDGVHVAARWPQAIGA